MPVSAGVAAAIVSHVDWPHLLYVSASMHGAEVVSAWVVAVSPHHPCCQHKAGLAHLCCLQHINYQSGQRDRCAREAATAAKTMLNKTAAAVMPAMQQTHSGR